MQKQSEQILEEQLIAQLQKMAYEFVPINNETDLINNLKQQLEKHNADALNKTGDKQFTELEFKKVLNILSKGNVFDKAKTLRELQHIVRDNGNNLYFEFIQVEHWCQNQFQVTRQITNEGKYKNRYDVTILINGLPLVQIELKRRGLELKEAFNQINRYQRHSFGANAALFQYIQIFIISNGVNIKYYDIFYKLKQQGSHNLNIATIFSYGANEDDADANGLLDIETNFDNLDFNLVAEPQSVYYNAHTREKLDEYIKHYNQQFQRK